MDPDTAFAYGSSSSLLGLHRPQVAVPDVAVHLRHRDAGLAAALPDQAQLDALGDLAEQPEVRARPVEGGAQGVGLAWPDLHLRSLRADRSIVRRPVMHPAGRITLAGCMT